MVMKEEGSLCSQVLETGDTAHRAGSLKEALGSVGGHRKQRRTWVRTFIVVFTGRGAGG